MDRTDVSADPGGRRLGYRFVDTLAENSVALLSLIVSAKTITKPFWNRWRASLIGDDTIMEFLESVRRMDDWPAASLALADREAQRFAVSAATSREHRVRELRRLSYLCHMGQWGCVEPSATKLELYRRSRDYYIEAETLAHGDRYHRFAVPWKGRSIWANLHLPDNVPPPYRVVVILHGCDDSKEEHLMTELGAQEKGVAVVGFDGPGQGEALLIDGMTWSLDFEEAAMAVLDHVVKEYGCDPERTGAVGISWGGMWVYKLAARDRRIKAVYDLGGPVGWGRWWRSIPFFLKKRLSEVVGAQSVEEMDACETAFSIESPEILERVRCAVRVVHGTKDPVVRLADKEWLVENLRRLHPDGDIALKIFAGGDHCCTGQAAEVRSDAADFFVRVLGAAAREEEVA